MHMHDLLQQLDVMEAPWTHSLLLTNDATDWEPKILINLGINHTNHIIGKSIKLLASCCLFCPSLLSVG